MPEITDLLDMEFDDPELEPNILPADARLSLRGMTAELKSLFERLSAVTPQKEVIPNTSFVHVAAVDGVVRFTATDGTQTLILESSDIKILREGKALLPGHKLKTIFALAPEDRVTVTLIGTTGTVTSGRAIWTVAVPTATAAPAVPHITDIELQPVPRRYLLRALQSAKRALPTLGMRKALEQASVAAGAVTASDGYRLIRREVPGLPDGLHFTIPKDTVAELERALLIGDEENVQVGASSDLLVVRDGGGILVSRQLSLDFPDLEKLLLAPALENQNSIVVDARELGELVKRVRVSADPEYLTVTLRFSKTKDKDWELTVMSRDRSGNSASEAMFAMWEGDIEPFDITINHRYLTDLLEAYGKGLATIKVGVNTKTRAAPLLLKDDEAGFVGVVQQSIQR